MSERFSNRYAKQFLAGWGTMDINGHLANTAYLDLAADVRMALTYAVISMSPDGARFVVENEIWTEGGQRAATIRSTGGWLDLRARKLVAPPAELLAAFQQVPRAPHFVELPSSREAIQSNTSER